jgi:putative FmdB family regulatory protein
MSIYEFYCPECHTVFNFFSRRINTETVPSCPKCRNPNLERQMSIFSVSKGHRDKVDETIGDIDEQKLEKALTSLAGEMEGVDEDDPKQAARLMRRLFETTGLNPGSGMQEAMNRMEAGEDPEKIEAEMGDILEQEDPFAMVSKQGLKTLRRRYLPPNVDETLYDLE